MDRSWEVMGGRSSVVGVEYTTSEHLETEWRLKVKRISTSLFFFGISLVICSSACSHQRVEPERVLARQLAELSLEKFPEKDDFRLVLSDLLSGQESCDFSEETLRRITFGSDDGVFRPMKSDCIEVFKINDIQIDDIRTVGITVLDRADRVYYVQAFVDEDNQWRFYWPELLRKGLHARE